MDVAHAEVLRGMDAVRARGREILARVPADRATVGAEIGVFKGQLSAFLLTERSRLTLYMIDSWLPGDEQLPAYRETGDFHSSLSREEQDRHYAQAREAVAFAGARAKVHRSDSLLAASWIPEGYLDFVFLDADHSFAGAFSDIEAWRVKVKPGGYLCGHDYGHPTRPEFGVKQAVDDAVRHFGWTLELGADMTWFARV